MVSKTILSFGGGLQTTALAIMLAKGELKVDEVVFADTGAEKPETYWYIENYIKPMIPITIVSSDKEDKTLYDYCWRIRDIPSVTGRRWCTDKYKVRVINKLYGPDKSTSYLIGFSAEERKRVNPTRVNLQYPLIERDITSDSCREIIREYGFPLPLKSSCFFCPYQHPVEWNWLKNNHPDLFGKALELEANYHQKKPQFRDSFGLLRGTPLWKMANGLQPEMFADIGYSCWSGHCGH